MMLVKIMLASSFLTSAINNNKMLTVQTSSVEVTLMLT
jgi:hypothetical protein